jgi:predicted AAA+ superfamily ATPase
LYTSLDVTMAAAQITLSSNTLLGKYVLVYACEHHSASITHVEYLYNRDLPCFDLHLSKELRKDVTLCVPSAGSYVLTYNAHPITLHVKRLYEGHSGLLADEQNAMEIVREVTLSSPFADSLSVLHDFVQQAKAYVEKRIAQIAHGHAHMLTRYSYNTVYGEWEVLNRSPKRSMDSVFIPATDKKRLMEHVQAFVAPQMRMEYEQYSVPYKSNVLLYGPPGTGKTSTIQALASMVDSDICMLSFTHDLDDAKLIRAINSMSSLERARVLVFEDVDCLFEDRKENDTARNAVTLSGLLNVMDGLMRAEGIMVFLTANHVKALDAAFLRPGRIDMAVRYKAPMGREEVRAMFKYYAAARYSDEAFEQLYNPVQYKPDLVPSLLQGFFFQHRHAPDLVACVGDLLALTISSSKLKGESNAALAHSARQGGETDAMYM